METKVTVTNLELGLRMLGLIFDNKTLSKIVGLIALIEEKGNDTSIDDICKLRESISDYF